MKASVLVMGRCRVGSGRALCWVGCLLLAIACGEPAREAKGPRPATRVELAPGLTAEERERMEQLLALGYLEGSEPAPEQKGVTVHRRDAAQAGLNLVVSGHAPEAVLLDMDGRLLHRWHRAFYEVWPPSEKKTELRKRRYWRRAQLLPNGDLLAIFDGLGLIKLDRSSKLLWAYDGAAHHDLFVLEDGTIYVLTRERRINPIVSESDPIDEDYITLLDPNGKELRRISLLEAVANSEYAGWLDDMPRRKGDVFHTNTIEVLDGRLAAVSDVFRAGNVLVSIPMLHAIAVFDLELERIVWGLRGGFRFQHQPTVLDSGRILLFDNLGTPKRSSVLEIDPATGEVVWRYQADRPGVFYTFSCGSNQRLPNGNTLITESDAGRAFEIDADREVVWEYWNPHRVPDPTQRGRERIATLFEVVRLPADLALDWLEKLEVTR
jgi:hypothetical protein